MFTIDFHVHPITLTEVSEKDDKLLENVKRVFKLFPIVQPTRTLIASLDAADVDKTVLLPIDCETTHRCMLPSNTIIAKMVDQYPDRFIGFASVDPNKGDSALEELDHAVKDLKLKGLKLYPSLQNFYPNDQKFYPLYDRVEKLNIPILFHSGTSWGEGKDKFNNVTLLDDLASDYPKLKIVIAHFGWPLVWETIALAIKYDNVFIDLSGLPSGLGLPKEHFELIVDMISRQLLQRCLADKLVFGSDFPRTDVNRMASALRELSLPKDVENKILGDNAARILNLK